MYFHIIILQRSLCIYTYTVVSTYYDAVYNDIGYNNNSDITMLF